MCQTSFTTLESIELLHQFQNFFSKFAPALLTCCF